MSHSPPLASFRHYDPGIIQFGQVPPSQTQLQAVWDTHSSSGFIGGLGQLASQMSRPHKSAKVHEGILTPSEDEEEEEEIADSGQEYMSREEYYAQAEQEEEDDDPKASSNLENDHPPTLLHPPIAIQHFAEEEDELFSSPVASRPLENLNEGQNLNGNHGAIFCSSLASSAQNPPNMQGASALQCCSDQQDESIFNEAMASPHPIRFLQLSDSTLLVLQMDACRDPDSPSPLPRQPLQGYKILPIDFSGRKRVEHSQSVFEQTSRQGLPLPSTRPLSAGPPVQQLPSVRPTKLGYLWSKSPYYHAHSCPSSAASISHSTTHRTSQEHLQTERPTDLGSTATFATSYPSLAGQPIAGGNVEPLLKGIAGHSKSPSQPAVPMLQVMAPSPITPVATRNLDQFSFNTGIPSTPANTYLHPSTAHDEASFIETGDGFEALNNVPMDVLTQSGIPDNASEVEDKPSPCSEVEAELSEPCRTGHLQAETVSRIEEAANQIWQVIKETTKINAAIQLSHIINCAFLTVVAHKMSYWNVFLVKYKAEHPNESWDQDQASLAYSNFKESFPNDKWKGILVEYAKVMDLDAGQRTCEKHQSVFKNTFQELAKQLEYHAQWDGFEAIMAIVGTNPKDDRPSMRPALQKGYFADQKLCLKNDWAATHLRAYVQN
ncbi:uncharacterized protein EV420DRAFT_1742567 [Desarmillaria tabescens]|uniref:Uncharacterized protein n=1 Tax=Armillaria tabescens TaxID=1929756 RepID=A0AA39NRD7_ARMTA|nr:uncharacterized protein EV420DRAFT_1742567 [Desarmillaria tabescens]KAK0470123.1 hypothetical protein EV420DRAFT_1742567 [Desarmillaria tabescens]